LSFVYLAFGTSDPLPFSLPSDTSDEILADFELSRVLDSSDQLPADAKAALAFALLRDNIHSDVSSNLLTQLTNSFRVQGRTAYISETDSSSPNFLANGIALEAFTLNKTNTVLIEKLANFVAQDKEFNTNWWYSAEQLSHFMLALADYDIWRGNTNPDLEISVSSNNTELLTSHFTSSTQPPASVSYSFEQLKSNFSSNYITFTACCRGEASVVFGANFIPANISTLPIYRGITVHRVIQLLDSSNEPSGTPIIEAKIGQTVVTTIEVIIPDFVSTVKIVDLFPGALEPLDDSIYDTPTQPGPWWWIWNPFSRREFLKDKVIFYGQHLYPGSYTVKYYSIVNTPGEFVLSPTLAFDLFQPEVMGQAEGGIFRTTGYTRPEQDTITNNCIGNSPQPPSVLENQF